MVDDFMQMHFNWQAALICKVHEGRRMGRVGCCLEYWYFDAAACLRILVYPHYTVDNTVITVCGVLNGVNGRPELFIVEVQRLNSCDKTFFTFFS